MQQCGYVLASTGTSEAFLFTRCVDVKAKGTLSLHCVRQTAVISLPLRSFRSAAHLQVGYSGVAMAPLLVGNAGYLQHQDILQMTNFNASTLSWLLAPSVAYPGSFTFVTRHPKFFGFSLATGNSISTCSVGSNWVVSNTLPPVAFTIKPPLAPFGSNQYATGQPQISSTNNVYIQSAAVTNAAITAASSTLCGSSLASLSSLASTKSSNTIWALVPPLSCSSTCNTFSFSLASLGTQNGFLYVNASGAVKVGNANLNSDFTTTGASFVANRVFYFGTPGWTISSSLDAAASNVLTRTTNAAGAGVCAAYFQVSSRPLTASGVTVRLPVALHAVAGCATT